MKKWTFVVAVALVALMTACSSGVDTTVDNGLPDVKSAPTTGTSGNSVTLVQLNPTAGGPYIGDKVTFKVSSSISSVWVKVECYQNSKMVYTDSRGFFPSYPWGQTYTLGPTTVWTSGPASCKGDLITTTKRGTSVLASTSFNVAGR